MTFQRSCNRFWLKKSVVSLIVFHQLGRNLSRQSGEDSLIPFWFSRVDSIATNRDFSSWSAHVGILGLCVCLGQMAETQVDRTFSWQFYGIFTSNEQILSDQPTGSELHPELPHVTERMESPHLHSGSMFEPVTFDFPYDINESFWRFMSQFSVHKSQHFVRWPNQSLTKSQPVALCSNRRVKETMGSSWHSWLYPPGNKKIFFFTSKSS